MGNIQNFGDDYVLENLFLVFVNCIWRSSHQRCSIEISVLKNFTKFTGKHLYQSFFFNEAAGLRPTTLLKRGSGAGIFL